MSMMNVAFLRRRHQEIPEPIHAEPCAPLSKITIDICDSGFLVLADRGSRSPVEVARHSFSNERDLAHWLRGALRK